MRPGEQDPNWKPYGDLVAEQAECYKRAYEAAVWYRALSDQTARRMREFEVRCPSHGCGLAEVVRLPLQDGGTRFLVLAHTRTKATPGFLNWAFSDDWAGPVVWWQVGCRHGQARLERAWLLDCAVDLDYLKRGWVIPHLDKLSETVRRGLAKRVFHPEPAVWRPKGKQGPGIVGPTN